VGAKMERVAVGEEAEIARARMEAEEPNDCRGRCKRASLCNLPVMMVEV